MYIANDIENYYTIVYFFYNKYIFNFSNQIQYYKLMYAITFF